MPYTWKIEQLDEVVAALASRGRVTIKILPNGHNRQYAIEWTGSKGQPFTEKSNSLDSLMFRVAGQELESQFPSPIWAARKRAALKARNFVRINEPRKQKNAGRKKNRV